VDVIGSSVDLVAGAVLGADGGASFDDALLLPQLLVLLLLVQLAAVEARLPSSCCSEFIAAGVGVAVAIPTVAGVVALLGT
jgi:hypothetical protein